MSSLGSYAHVITSKLHTGIVKMSNFMQVFADMEELGMRPTMGIVKMVGDVFLKLDMMDKYQKLNKKYPPPKWEYRYIKGKRVKIRRQDLHSSKDSSTLDKESHPASYESIENAENSLDEVEDCQLHSTDVSVETIDSSSVF